MCPAILGHLQPIQLSDFFGGGQIATTGVSGPPSTCLRTVVRATIPTATAAAVTATADTTRTIGSTLGAD